MLLANTELCAARSHDLVDRVGRMQIAHGGGRGGGGPDLHGQRRHLGTLALQARIAARRTTRHSSGLRTSSTSNCLTRSIGETRTPRRGWISTKPSNFSRCSASLDRCPAAAKLLAELVLGDHRAWPQLARDDHLLDRAIGSLGQKFAGSCRRAAVQFQCHIAPLMPIQLLPPGNITVDCLNTTDISVADRRSTDLYTAFCLVWVGVIQGRSRCAAGQAKGRI